MQNNPKKYTDSQLVKQINQSDAQAFKNLYHKYASMLYAFLWRKTGNVDLAKDLVQEVFIRTWNNREKLNPDMKVKSYLYRIAGNLAIDHLRYKTLHPTAAIEDNFSGRLYTINENFDVEPKIREAVNGLPETQRKIFYLSRFEGLKHKEIAELLGISIKTVESNMSKALKKLREVLRYLLVFILYIGLK